MTWSCLVRSHCWGVSDRHRFWGQVVAYPWEKLSDLRQAIYPEGFYTVRSLLPGIVLIRVGLRVGFWYPILP